MLRKCYENATKINKLVITEVITEVIHENKPCKKYIITKFGGSKIVILAFNLKTTHPTKFYPIALK